MKNFCSNHESKSKSAFKLKNLDQLPQKSKSKSDRARLNEKFGSVNYKY